MFTFDKNEKLTGAIVNVPCPSQNCEGEYGLSADYWHDVRELLRSKYGDIGIISHCAAAGDITPRILHYEDAEKRRFELKYNMGKNEIEKERDYPRGLYRRMDAAERICNAFDEVYAWASKDIIKDAEVKHTAKTVMLEKFLITDEEYEKCSSLLKEAEQEEFIDTGDFKKDSFHNSFLTTKITRYKAAIERYHQQKNDLKAPVLIHVVKIGDVAFVTSPFELYTAFQHIIQARSPFIQTFVIQLCDQPKEYLYARGYLPTKVSTQNKGYGSQLFSSFISADGGRTLAEETLNELKNIY